MSVPAWLQTLRSLRPAHVVTALPRGHGLLLLNPRDLRRADDAPIPRIQVPALFLVAPVLRAARDAGALVALSKPGAVQGEGPSAGQFAAAVVHAADELSFAQPLYLASAPLPVPGGPNAGDHLRGEVQRYLDAGFTEIALAADEALAPDAWGTLLAGLSAVREREISLVLAARDAAHAQPLQDEISRAGFTTDLLALAAADEAAHAPLELPLGLATTSDRGVDLSAPILELAREALGERVEPSRARELEQVDEATVQKLEALTYAEALRLLREEPFRGAAQRVMRHLAEQPGY